MESGSISVTLESEHSSRRRAPPRYVVQTSWGTVYSGRDLQAARRVLRTYRQGGDLAAMFVEGRWYHHERGFS
jgi:hypothetical protein